MSANNNMSLIISGIEEQYSPVYIANTFWNLNIAKVSSIILTPNGVAYVEIKQWCDTEIAYNFIHRLNNLKKETRLVHYQDDWWIVSKNNKKNVDLDELGVEVEVNKVVFDDSYFVKMPLRAFKNGSKSDAGAHFKPIKSIRNYSYSVEDALNELVKLKKHIVKIKKNTAFTENLLAEKILISYLIEEYLYLENELAIHRSVSKSQNVTVRRKNQVQRKS